MIRLKIRRHGNNAIKLIPIEGVECYGFGVFLNNIQPKEIECDKFSKNAILNAQELDGLNDMEIWRDNRIAWMGNPHSETTVLITEISKHKGANEWLKKIPVKSESRKGWRKFVCDECGTEWETPTRDCLSPSSETCSNCGLDIHPDDSRFDASLPSDELGNLI